MGKVSTDGLAATNVVFRINGLAFFPVVGLATAVSMLVGQAQGAGRPDLSRKVTMRGLLLGQVWMCLCAIVMVAMPGTLLGLFFDTSRGSADAGLYTLCVHLLWFVAAYTLLDGINIVFMSMLSGAGDMRFMLVASGSLHVGLVLLMYLLVRLGAGTYGLWTTVTLFICCVSVVWVARFRSGRWQDKRVIEHAPPDIAEMPATEMPM
jgi:MATE family multidrug resistance protein